MVGLHWFGYDIASYFYTHCRTDTPQGTVELNLENIPGKATRKVFVATYLQGTFGVYIGFFTGLAESFHAKMYVLHALSKNRKRFFFQ